MFEFIFELLGEFLLQVLGELLIEMGFHSLAEPFRCPPNPWLAALGYVLFGLIVGGISVLLVPHNLVPEAWRVANLILTPFAVGGMMTLLGAWRARRGQTLWRIDKFVYGYLFALAVAVVRYVATT